MRNLAASSVLIFTLAVLLVALPGCATAPAPRMIEAEDQIHAGFETVWTALVSSLAERNVPIKTIDKASGIVVTEEMAVRNGDNNYCDCGGNGIATEDRRAASYNVYVKRVTDEICSVRVNARFYSIVSFGSTASRKECVSTGQIEGSILSRLREAASKGSQ